MILSTDGLIKIVAAFVNIFMLAAFLDLDTTTTRLYAQIPMVKLVFLFTFAYSVIPNKTACIIATALFFVLEIQNFVSDTVDTITTTTEE